MRCAVARRLAASFKSTKSAFPTETISQLNFLSLRRQPPSVVGPPFSPFPPVQILPPPVLRLATSAKSASPVSFSAKACLCSSISAPFELLGTHRPTFAHTVKGICFLRWLVIVQPSEKIQISGVPSRRIGQGPRRQQGIPQPQPSRPRATLRQKAQAAPAIVVRLSHRNDPGPHRIQMNIMRHRAQMRPIFHDDCLIPALKYMAAFPAKPVESIRVRRLQPLHPLHEIRLRRFQRQMVMIPHDHVAVHLPSRFVHILFVHQA